MMCIDKVALYLPHITGTGPRFGGVFFLLDPHNVNA